MLLFILIVLRDAPDIIPYHTWHNPYILCLMHYAELFNSCWLFFFDINLETFSWCVTLKYNHTHAMMSAGGLSMSCFVRWYRKMGLDTSMCNTPLDIIHACRQLFKRFSQFFLIKFIFQCPNHPHCSIPVLVPLKFFKNVVPRTGYTSWSLILNCFCIRAIVEDSWNWCQHNRKIIKWLGKVGINLLNGS